MLIYLLKVQQICLGLSYKDLVFLAINSN